MRKIYPYAKRAQASHFSAKGTSARYGVGVYLDYAATTPIDSRAVKAMLPYFTEKFGNTMSLHTWGQEAKLALEKSRQTVAGLIGAKANEIIFTSSATESNNFALKGIAFANKDKGRHIIISSIEHPCIVEAAEWLKNQGVKITKIKNDKYGLINPLDVKKAIKNDTILVSIIHASNEIGTIQDIEKIGKICREKGVCFHTDAVQSFGKIPIDVNKMNIDLLTASSHKIYGPKGAACLFVRDGIYPHTKRGQPRRGGENSKGSPRYGVGARIEPLLHGGGQEIGLRGSTVNVGAIVGFAKAVEICKKEMKKENERLFKLRDKLIEEVLKIKESHLNGHPKKRLANNANFWFSFIEGESLIIQLDLKGIAVSTGSACSSIKLEPSPALLAIGLKPQEAHGSLRVSLGRWTKKKDIDYLIKVLPNIVKQLRKISPYG